MVNDIALFVDYAVYPENGRVVVCNKIDGTTRTFHDLNSAVDYAASRTSTMSPRYPKGYRSATVRMLEALGVDRLATLFGLSMDGEEIEYDGKDLPTDDDDQGGMSPVERLRHLARGYLQHSLEAESAYESKSWMERSCDLHSEAGYLERQHVTRDTDEREDDSRGNTDPWRHQSGRAGGHARSKRLITQTKHG